MTRLIIALWAFVLVLLTPAMGETVSANFTSASSIPVTASSYTADGNDISLSLGFAPPTGTNLSVINNTGLAFITGRFSNLPQGQPVFLSFAGNTYKFVANYYGGSGNDLVLHWAWQDLAVWGLNDSGQLGNNIMPYSSVPLAMAQRGALAGKTVLAASAGDYHTLALCADGTLAAWGNNSYGRLGNNSTTDSSVPINVTQSGVLAGKTVVAVAAGTHSLALCSDGTLAAWGYNASGQLGNNSTTDSSVPVEVTHSGALAGKTVVAISAGRNHSLALCSDGTLAAWGSNYYGQLGNNSTTNSSEPVAVTQTGVLAGKTVVAITAGYSHSLALCSDGTLAAWGSNLGGQLGNNSTTNSSVPVAVTQSGVLAGKSVVAISNGAGHSLALCSDGTLATWGVNQYSQPGNNSTVPVDVTQSGVLAGKTVAAIEAGHRHNLALCSDGTLAAWGSNPNGELGNNSTTDSQVPVAVTQGVALAGKTLATFAAGGTYCLALTNRPPSSDSTLANLGLHGGALGHPNGNSYQAYVAPTVAAVTLTPTASHANASITVNGLSVASGSESQAIPVATEPTVISVVITAENDTTTTYQVTVTKAQSIDCRFLDAQAPAFDSLDDATGLELNLSLGFAPPAGTSLPVANNTGRAWINGRFNNLGQGQSVDLSYNGKSYKFVANYYGGSGNDLMLQWGYQDLAAWGSNSNGQLGNNSTTTSKIPVAVTQSGALAGKIVVAIAAGGSHNLALCSDGVLAAWGSNSNGQLGNNGTTDSAEPIAVTQTGVLAGKTVIAIAAGSGHSLALCSDGTLAAWGRNSYGQLGNNSTTNSSFPVVVTQTGALANKTVVAIAAGFYHSLALCSDGTLAAWGRNSYGQLGNNSMTDSNVPVALTQSGVLVDKTISAIAAGGSHSLALCADGTLAAWGNNYPYGQLGNNSMASSSVPVAVSHSGGLAGKIVSAIAAGAEHSTARCTDGSLVAWGDNGSGQLGNNSLTYSNVPVAVTTSGVLVGKTVIALAAGGNHNLALYSDGTLAAWGSNASGQLGNNTTTSSKVPVAITQGGQLAGKSVIAISAGAGHSLVLANRPISSDSTLANLTLHRGALGPRNGNSYQACVSPAVTSLTLTASASDAKASITVNGVNVTSGSESQSIPLADGANQISVVVTAEDGSATSYQVAVTRSAPVDFCFTDAQAIPALDSLYDPTGLAANLSLGFAPSIGTNLTVIKNPGLAFIPGCFTNLAQGQQVLLSYKGNTYKFVANYFGGSGNDLILQWAYQDMAAWGSNNYGQLGDNTSMNSAEPTAVTQSGVLAGKTISAIAAGDTHNLALCADGTLAAWGGNSYGQLGNNSTALSLEPVAVTQSGELANKTVVAIAAGASHSLALCSDGTLAAWGANYPFGQLGNNSTVGVSVSVPVSVTHSGVLAGKTVVAIAAGGSHNLALCSDGTLAAWGNNSEGQLGNNSKTNSSVPIAVTNSGVLAGKTVVAITAGYYHSLALCSDGTLAAWGYNSVGQLGNNSTTSSSVPVAVTTNGLLTDKTVIAVSAGDSHNLALCADGTLAAWGANDYGELGDNSTSHSSVPVAVTQNAVLADKNVVAIAAGNHHSLALCSNGTLAAWGVKLGNSTTTYSPVPVAVTSSGALAGQTVVAISAGGFHTLVQTAAQRNHVLSGLTTSAGLLDPIFTSDTTSYNCTVANPTTSLTVTATAYNPTAAITVNGIAIASGSTSGPIPLSVGVNPITITVTDPQDESLTNTYILSVTRAPSVNCALAGLRLSTGTLTPKFAPATTIYTAAVANAVSSLKLTPTLVDLSAKVTVNGTPVANGSATAGIPLAVGVNTIQVRVTAQGGATFKTYTVKVTRAKSSDATLSGLVVKNATLGPKFKPTTTGYSASVSRSVKSVTIKPTANNKAALIKVNGKTVKTGTLSAAILLQIGKNTLNVVVTAENGVTKTYKIVITRTTSTGAAPKFALAGSRMFSLPEVTRATVNGQRYLQLTVLKPNPKARYVVEVSPNLVDWFSGERHTSILVDDGQLLRVRDKTPVTPDAKRFIRVRETGKVGSIASDPKLRQIIE